MLKKILRWLRKYRSIWNGWNDFRIVYPSGDMSYRLRHDEAMSVAECYNGKVIYAPLEEENDS